MKTAWHRWGWKLVKGLLALAILGAIGVKFQSDLSQLDLATLELRPGWLALSATLYLLGLLPSAWFWYHLLHVFGDRPRFYTAVRAYYLGQVGKYVPGKALAVILRCSFVRGPEVRFGVAVLTTFYEVLATMAAGALAAAIVFAVYPPDVPGLGWHPLLTVLMLLAVCGVPLLPGVFNFMVGRMARHFQRIDAFRLPPLRFATLTLGLFTIMAGWLLLGVSVWALLQGVLPEPPAWSFEVWMHCAGSIGLAYVAGFLIVFLPGGIGAREYFLGHLLGFAGPQRYITLTVLLLRLVWTAAEVMLAGVLLVVRRLGSGSKTEPRPLDSLRTSRGLEVTP